MQPAVSSEFATIVRPHDRPGRVGHIGAKKVLHLHFADEADALAVLFVGRRQAGFAREPAQLGLLEIVDRETRRTDLLLIEQGEEIGLILVFVGAFVELAKAVSSRDPTRVVPRRQRTEPLSLRVAGEHAEFHLAVAHRVRVRRQAVLVAVEEVIHHETPVILHQVDDAELDADGLGVDQPCACPGGQPSEIDVALVEGIVASDEARNHARVGRLYVPADQRQPHARHRLHTEALQDMDMGVAAANQHEILEERSGLHRLSYNVLEWPLVCRQIILYINIL